MLAATVVFVLINGFFVAAEFSLVKVRPSRMQSLASTGNRRAGMVCGMLEQLDLYLSGCQLGITIASLILGWLAEPAVAVLIINGASELGFEVAHHAWLHPVALACALTVVTMLHMTIGEQAPKIWSIQKAETAVLLFAVPLRVFVTVFKPMIWIINWLSNWMLRVSGTSSASDHHGAAYDAAELRSILDASARAGHLTARQKTFGENILGLACLEVRHIMVPRLDVAYLSTERSREENLEVIRTAGHSRLPLCDPDLDNVVGVVHTRALLEQLLANESPCFNAIARKCPAVADTQPLSRLIVDLQRERTHCALVVDEYGTTIGLAFLEDAMEEIVGPIYDEFDEAVCSIDQTDGHGLEMAGSVALPAAGDALGIVLDDEADTIGGYVTAKLGRIPQPGETLDIGPYKATVTTVTKRRVVRIRFEKEVTGPPVER